MWNFLSSFSLFTAIWPFCKMPFSPKKSNPSFYSMLKWQVLIIHYPRTVILVLHAYCMHTIHAYTCICMHACITYPWTCTYPSTLYCISAHLSGMHAWQHTPSIQACIHPHTVHPSMHAACHTANTTHNPTFFFPYKSFLLPSRNAKILKTDSPTRVKLYYHNLHKYYSSMPTNACSECEISQNWLTNLCQIILSQSAQIL